MIVKCANAAGVSYYGNVFHHTFFGDRHAMLTLATGVPEKPLHTIEFTDGECSLISEQGVALETRTLKAGDSDAGK